MEKEFFYSEDTLLIGRPLDHYDLGDGTLGVITQDANIYQLEPDELFIVQALDRFSIGSDIPSMLEEKGWQSEDPEYTDELIQGLITKGLLLAQDQVKEKYKTLISDMEKNPGPKRSISIINWVTCDRPELLERSMRSFIENCKQYNHEPLYRVCDDSKTLDMRNQNRAIVEKLGTEYQINVSYLGYEEKLTLIDDLLTQPDQIFSKDELRFLLFGVLPDQEPLTLDEMTAGANANAAYLAAGDAAVLMVDDDIVCETWLAEPTDSSVQLCLENSGENFSFYKSYEHMAQYVDPTTIDVIATFDQFIDSPRELYSGILEDLDWDQLTPAETEYLWIQNPRVALCCAGAHGDSGMGSNVHFRHWGEGAKKRFFPDAETYQTAMTSRILRRWPEKVTISRDQSFQTMIYSIVPSKSGLLYPATRAADDIFWFTSMINNKNLVKMRLPFSLGHYAATVPVYKDNPPKVMDTLTHIFLRLKTEHLLVMPDPKTLYQEFLLRTEIMRGKVISEVQEQLPEQYPNKQQVLETIPIALEKVELFRSIYKKRMTLLQLNLAQKAAKSGYL
jgi:hypothetical protein